MNKNLMEMTIGELDLLYGKPTALATITHVLGVASNTHHDRVTVEVFTEDSKRLLVKLTQDALRQLIQLVGNKLDDDRPKLN